MAKRCLHVNRRPDQGNPDHMECLDCGRTFRPRNSPTRHGTYLGYCKHRRARSGEWGWPACGKCKKAQWEWTRDYARTPGATRSRRLRAQSRVAALASLARVYPGDYLAAYSAELGRRGLELVRPQSPPDWEQCLERLLKVAGFDHHDLARSVAGGWGTSREKEVYRLSRQLRWLLADRHRPKAPESQE